MTAPQSVEELNRNLADRINEQARKDPTSHYAGRFVGISNGEVLAVTDDLDSLVERLRQLEADPSTTLCLEAGLDYEQPQEIWGVSARSARVSPMRRSARVSDPAVP